MKLKKIRNKKRKGFTLVEMIIVVVILGILSSIGLVKYNKVQENAKLNADYLTAKNIATATSMAISDGSNIIDDKMVTLDELESNDYLTSRPKSQTDGEFFKIDIRDGDITITNSSGEIFYPIPEQSQINE